MWSPRYVRTSTPARLQPPARLVVSLQRERSARAEGEHVRAHRLELVVRHLHDLDPPLGEQLHQPHRGDPRIHERKVTVER